MAEQTSLKFDAPIPGMSLTTEPGNRPWENPPKFTDVEDVLDFYIDRMGDDERSVELMAILEEGLTVNMLVDSMVTTGVMSGLHTLEAGLLAAPVLSEFVQAMADIEGVSYTVSTEDKTGGLSEAMTKKAQRMIKQELQAELEAKNSGRFTEGEEVGEPTEEEEVPTEGVRRGLMARPVALLAEVTEVDAVEQPEDEGEEA